MWYTRGAGEGEEGMKGDQRREAGMEEKGGMRVNGGKHGVKCLPWIQYLQEKNILHGIIFNIWAEWQFFNVAGYLYVIEESRRSTVIYAYPRGQF